MDYRELRVSGAWAITPKKFSDDRGTFLEWFKHQTFIDATGRDLELAQANCSVSSAGVLRGIHYSDMPPGQAKYVTCVSGSVLDVVVDLRVDSPTFGEWDSVLLDTHDRRAIFLTEGLGHAFLSLEDQSTVVYLCSTPYDPDREHEVNPLDPAIGVAWPSVGTDGKPLTYELSVKDRAAPTLSEAREAGRLPR